MLNRLAQGIALLALLAAPAIAQQHRQRAGTPPHAGASGFRGGIALPHPNGLNRGFAPLDRNRWRGGHWYHGLHDGRLGWWWSVGPSWFFYNSPVYPFPDVYGPPGSEAGWWYWCDARQEYYPYVTYCPSGWRRLPPR
jgi:hypothetical protein